MAFRSGIYIVPTDSWYIERSVWLTAGFVLLASTALAWLVEPIVVLMIIVTGLVSIMTGLTGLDPVGNVFHRLGFKSKLSDDPEGEAEWYVHSPWWLTFTGFVGAAMVWFAATGFCIMANGLYWTGAEPRLNPEKETALPKVPPTEAGGPLPQS